MENVEKSKFSQKKNLEKFAKKSAKNGKNSGIFCGKSEICE